MHMGSFSLNFFILGSNEDNQNILDDLIPPLIPESAKSTVYEPIQVKLNLIRGIIIVLVTAKKDGFDQKRRH